MKVLLVHNRYRLAGGEDTAFDAERALLESHGHTVVTNVADNREIGSAVGAATDAIWSRSSRRELGAIVCRERPDVMHCHNTFPRVSPSAYDAAREWGVPVVQTLHNYRLACPSAILFRDGRPCEDCLGRTLAWPAVVHGCYRGSRAASAAVAAMLAVHRWRGTWTTRVDAFIALSDFARERMQAAGLPGDRLHVRPNFLAHDPGPGTGDGAYALFLGRLVPEKGLPVVLEAWARHAPGLPLRVAGDGPQAELATAAASQQPDVMYLGARPRDEARALIERASLLIFPTLWYEAFPMVLVEAMAAGTPVIASRLGATAEIVEHGRTGLTFAPGDAAALAAAVREANAPERRSALSRGARQAFLSRYTATAAHERLLEIYAAASRTATRP